ncbi:hypothetical protein BAUCODRAFT_122372 [Baudoinia panamericana UAMH 10762]|uniref:Thiamine pyrophosphokinase n=1 Tax=Baudoinia panamericana (strain UAMH 10762) TaxID=717646 RepID=M2MI74_BAUPA|nr:uncharacterized protein BAUCODRAFT_122372 [Baudoinia panamericana UAMH 10762]EMC96366.1 hypothetical protein BAUCODRAFT_122372 [Baudoinia panamericana UAMH 10762]
MASNDNLRDNIEELKPTHYLESRMALIILNSPIPDLEYFRRLYDHASLRICADGGANRLYDLLLKQYGESKWIDGLRAMPPDLIHGDLDSLHDTVRKRYEQIGVQVTQDTDQYSTDFGKAINQVIERMPTVQTILVAGSLGGRVDQGIGLLHELYREQKLRHPRVRFWFFSEASVSTLLNTGATGVHTPVDEGLITRNIGILPLYGPATISTKGLEWDVEDWRTEIGGQVSTSNHIVADHITISTDNQVLFTVERAA